MTLLAVYFLLAVAVSFLCSLLESVMLSVSPAHISIMAQEGKQSGKILQKLKAQIDRPLAAILTVNTVANTLGAAGVGAQVHKIYGNEYVTGASAALTLMILIFSEIIPKTMGATYWKALAPMCAYLIRMLIFVVYPFVLLSELLYSLLSKGKSQRMTREEMIVTAEIGANDGTLRQKESLVIRNLLMLDKVTVSDIMTPRSVILAFEKNQTVGQLIDEHKPIRFSRIPIFVDHMDHVIGMIHRYKLMEAASHDQFNLPIESLMQPLHSISEEISVAAALDQFIKRKEHVFLIVDDHNSTTGLVSLEDVVETLLGVEIVDEFDSVADMRQYARELWHERKKKVWATNKRG